MKSDIRYTFPKVASFGGSNINIFVARDELFSVTLDIIVEYR